MAIALKGSASPLVTGTASPITLDLTNIGAASGDFICMLLGAYATGGASLSSTGYTLDGAGLSTPPAPDLSVKDLYRLFQTGDTNPSAADGSSPGNGYGGLLFGFSGVDQTTPLDATTVAGAIAASTTPQPTGITTVTDNAVVVSMIVSTLNTSGGITVGTANGFTTILSGTSYVNTTRALAFAATYKLIASHGAVTCPVYSQASSKDSVGITLALRPASAAALTSMPRDRTWPRGLIRGFA